MGCAGLLPLFCKWSLLLLAEIRVECLGETLRELDFDGNSVLNFFFGCYVTCSSSTAGESSLSRSRKDTLTKLLGFPVLRLITSSECLLDAGLDYT